MRVSVICGGFLSFWALSAYAASIVPLGTAGDFAVLAGSTVTSTGNTLIDGNVGVSPGSLITGFYPPGIVNGTIYGSVYANGAVAAGAENDLTTAYNFAASIEDEPCGTNLSGMDLGGMNLAPGVYCFTSSAQLTGTLMLDALTDPNGVFVFKIATALTTASNSAVLFQGTDGGGNVFWQVGSSATLGAGTAFAGNILAYSSITLNTGASIDCGSALAENGTVMLDDNRVNGCSATPEPGTAMLLSMGLLSLILYVKQSEFTFAKSQRGATPVPGTVSYIGVTATFTPVGSLTVNMAAPAGTGRT